MAIDRASQNSVAPRAYAAGAPAALAARNEVNPPSLDEKLDGFSDRVGNTLRYVDEVLELNANDLPARMKSRTERILGIEARRAVQPLYAAVKAGRLQEFLAQSSTEELGKVAAGLAHPGLRGILAANPGLRNELFYDVVTARVDPELKALVANCGSLSQGITANSPTSGLAMGQIDSVLQYVSMDPRVRLRRHVAEAKGRIDDLRRADQPTKGNADYIHNYLKGLEQKAYVGTSIKPYFDGRTWMNRLTQSISSAGKGDTVLGFYFALQDDIAGREYRDALLKAKANGARVILGYDTQGSIKSEGKLTDPKFFDDMQRAGIEVFAHKPHEFGYDTFDHQKYTVVARGNPKPGQESVAFPSSRNMTADEINPDPTKEWTDLAYEMKGAGVNGYIDIATDKAERYGIKFSPKEKAALDREVTPVGKEVAYVLHHEGSRDHVTHYANLAMMALAKDGLFIGTPYSSNADEFKVMAEMASGEVAVPTTAMFPEANNQKFERAVSRGGYPGLTKNGVNVVEYVGKTLDGTVEPVMNHTKLRIAVLKDGATPAESKTIVVGGSGNGDQLSEKDWESNFLSTDPNLAAELRAKYVEPALANSKSMAEFNPTATERLAWLLRGAT